MRTIKFEKIIITNFLSFGKTQEYTFEDGITLVCGQNKDRVNDPNGCGKSTIFDAISFALFGKTMKSLTTSNLVNRLAKKNGLVQLNLLIDNKPFKIIRGVKPSKVSIIDGNSEIHLSGIKATDQFIADKIGTDYTTFRNTVMMTSNNTKPFLQQDAATKRGFIESLFNLEFIREMKKGLEEVNSNAMTKYNTLVMQKNSETRLLEQAVAVKKSNESRRAEELVNLNEQIAKYNDNISKCKIELSNIKLVDFDDIDKKIAKLNESKQYISSSVSSIIDEVNRYTNDKNAKSAKLLSLKNSIFNIDSFISKSNTYITEHNLGKDLNDVLSEKDNISDRIKEMSSSKLDNISRISELVTENKRENSDISSIVSGDSCPTCKRPFSDEEKAIAQNRIESMKQSIKNREVEIHELNKQNMSIDSDIAKCNVKIKFINAADAKEVGLRESMVNSIKDMDAEIAHLNDIIKEKTSIIDESKDKISNINTEISVLNSDKKHAVDIQNHYSSLVSQIKMYSDSVSSCNDRINSISNESSNKDDELINEYQSNVESFAKDIEDISFEISCCSIAKKILADDAYRAELVLRIVSALNVKANEYLSKLDAPVTINIDKYFSDNIVDLQTGESVEYDSLSGGEQRRVDLAMLLAFMEIRSMQGDAKFSMLFFDEILDSALSQQACCKLMDILNKKKEDDGTSSMVITHRKELLDNDNVDNKLMVVKIGGVSSLEKL